MNQTDCTSGVRIHSCCFHCSPERVATDLAGGDLLGRGIVIDGELDGGLGLSLRWLSFLGDRRHPFHVECGAEDLFRQSVHHVACG